MIEAFQELADYAIQGGGNDVETPDELQLVVEAVTDVFRASVGRMKGRVSVMVQQDLVYFLDGNNVQRHVEAYIVYCVRRSDGDAVDGFWNLVELVCGYYNDALGAEARYRLQRFAHICRQTPRSPRHVRMAASNVTNWLSRTLF